LNSSERVALVTGASGFVGTALCPVLEGAGWVVRRASSSKSGPGWSTVHPFDRDIDWRTPLAGCTAVVHLAGRTHITRGEPDDHDVLYRQINTAATLQLAREAVAAGVRRFVFISSVKVAGEGQEEPYREADMPSPQDSYGRSKWAAEQGLAELCRECSMELVILRLPLVYGPHVRGNFLKLMEWVDRGIPLPFGSIANARSLLGVENLADAITVCLTHTAAAGRTYFVSDGQYVSTPGLIRRIAVALGRTPRLLPVPVRLLDWVGRSIGQAAMLQRLTGSLTVDSSRISHELQWTPPYSLDAGLRHTASWYSSSVAKRRCKHGS